ncbi:MAG: ribonuclease HII [Chloroflexota bacterium]
MPSPSFAEERMLEAQGCRYIAGIDEAGRGALAGPVAAAAVILPPNLSAPWLGEVRDSKQMSPAKREIFFHHIHEVAVSVGIGMASHRVIDDLGIVAATRKAMRSAIERLSPVPEYLLIDYMKLPAVTIPQKGITNGDELCFSIACASIIAKVARDQLMMFADMVYPDYGFSRHKGYGTRAHLGCLERLGPCSFHRRSFRPVMTGKVKGK